MNFSGRNTVAKNSGLEVFGFDSIGSAVNWLIEKSMQLLLAVTKSTCFSFDEMESLELLFGLNELVN